MSNNKYLLSSVKNALKILNSFSEEKPEKTLGELATSLGIAKSTVSRLMATLASEGFIIKDPHTQRFRLGLAVLNLSGIVTSTMDIYREARPLLEQLSRSIDETCHLVLLDGTDVVYLMKVESSHPVRFSSHVGKRNPAYCTSSGKVMLAFQNEDVIEKVIQNGLRPILPNTITDPDQFRRNLRTIREQGYAVSFEELFSGVTSVGAPIRDYTGQVVAAITIAGPSQRIHRHNIQNYVRKALEVSKQISERLGYY